MLLCLPREPDPDSPVVVAVAQEVEAGMDAYCLLSPMPSPCSTPSTYQLHFSLNVCIEMILFILESSLRVVLPT